MLAGADIRAGARLLRRLPAFLRRPITAGEARATLRDRLERREADFLALARRLIYGHTASPYRPLLRMAGCEYGDLERLVGTDGPEGALAALAEQGAYLTGRVQGPAARRPRQHQDRAGSPGLHESPVRPRHARTEQREPRPPTPVLVALDYLRDCGVDTRLALDARRAKTG